MEALTLTILSIFAFLGVASMVRYFLHCCRYKPKDSGIKLILYIPENSESKLEGLIRQIFLEELPEKLRTDGKVYLMISTKNEDTKRIIEDLEKLYPLEVLPDPLSYCMITEKDKEQIASIQVE